MSVAIATRESMPIEVRAVGTVEPSESVQVKSTIAGELLKVNFAEGADVNQGDLLFHIDPRPYQEALRQSEAAVGRDTALLHQAEANLARDTAQLQFAEADTARTEQLLKGRIASRSQYDQTKATSDSLGASIQADKAAIESAKATIESDRAAIDGAKLSLSYCEIHSPISGRAGNLLIHVGNLVKANDLPIVVINKLSPIFVSFGVPQENLSSVRTGSVARKLAVRVSLQNDPTKTTNGEIAVMDNAVDTNTGTIRLKASFPNADRLLWPGEFVNVLLTLGSQNNAVVVPSEAIQAGQRGPFVFVVKPDQTVESRPVTVGPTVGQKAIIQSGVAVGETVVTDGQLRLTPGAHIQAVPASRIDSQIL